MTTLTVTSEGAVNLPTAVQHRYGLGPAAPLRLIETHSGILLIPLGDDHSLNADLDRELSDWQALGTDTWEMFPFEEGVDA